MLAPSEDFAKGQCDQQNANVPLYLEARKGWWLHWLRGLRVRGDRLTGKHGVSLVILLLFFSLGFGMICDLGRSSLIIIF